MLMPNGQEPNGTVQGWRVGTTHQHSTIDRHCTIPTFHLVQYNFLYNSVFATDRDCDVLNTHVSWFKKEVISQFRCGEPIRQLSWCSSIYTQRVRASFGSSGFSESFFFGSAVFLSWSTSVQHTPLSKAVVSFSLISGKP